MNETKSRRDSITRAIGAELGEHPTYETIEQFVDGTADDVTQEIVASHCEVCPRCDAEVRDLASFAGRARFSPFLVWVGAAAAVIALIALGAFLLRRRPAEAPITPQHVENKERQPAPAAVAASGYGREEWTDAVRIALERGALDPPPILADLRPRADALRTPAGGSTTPIMKPAGVVIESTTPTLTWRAAPGRFVVSVYDGFERVARSGVLREPQWQVAPPLPRGRTYTWQVEIRRGSVVELLPSAPAPAAFVHVLDERDAATLAEARRRFPDDPLLLGVLHARMGMQEAAVEELRRHAAQHPEERNASALAESVARW